MYLRTQTGKVYSISLTFIFSLFFYSSLIAQSTQAAVDPTNDRASGAVAGYGRIKGLVATSDKAPAAGVSVVIAESGRGVSTDEFGKFEFRKLEPGTYTLEVSLTGYETIKKTTTVTYGRLQYVTVQLAISNKTLDEVVVNSVKNPLAPKHPSLSLRLNEPLIEAPQNIQVVSSKALTDQQIISMSDGVLRNVSGAMRIEHWADMYANIHMRGSQVSSLRNGMNIQTSYWSPLTEDMSIVDHIEFIKGPAGFLMPVGDPAGLYNTVTKKPTGKTKGEVSLTAGSYDLYRGTIDLDGKLDKDGKLLYRLNMAGKSANSFRPYEFNNRVTVAPVLSYKLDDQTTLTAEYILNKARMSDVGTYYVFSAKGYAVLPRNFTTAPPGLDPTHITDQSINLNLQHRFDEHWRMTAQISYQDYKQTGSDLWPSSVGTDSMTRAISNWDAAATGKFGQAFLNGEVQTGALQHRVLIGFDLSDKEYAADWNQYHKLDSAGAQFSLYNPVYSAPVNGYPQFDHTSSLTQRAGPYGVVSQTYAGIYAQDELGFFDNSLRLTLAGRYSYVKGNDYGSDASAKQFTPRLGLSWSIDKHTSIYALYDQAFVPQSGFRRDGGRVKPLTGNNMEIGLKKDWSDGRWNSTVSAYRILRNNGNSSDPSDPTGRYIVQLGQTRSQGVEADIRGEVLPGLVVTANYAYTNAKVTKSDTSAIMKATIGQKVPGYATHTGNAWVSYQLQNGPLKGLGISGGLTLLADRQTWEWGATSAFQQLPDYTKIDGGLFWEKNKIRLSFNLYNLADAFLYSGSGYADYYYWQSEPGRNWRFGINYRW